MRQNKLGMIKVTMTSLRLIKSDWNIISIINIINKQSNKQLNNLIEKTQFQKKNIYHRQQQIKYRKMNKAKFSGQLELQKKKNKNIKQKKKPNQQEFYPNPKPHQLPPSQTKNQLSQYKMEINATLLDYMCYLEQLITDTKQKAIQQKKTVSNIILNMARFFDVPNVNEETINNFLQNVIVEGKQLEYQLPFDKLDWFDVLQEKRFESFLAEKPKDQEKISKETQIITKTVVIPENSKTEIKKKVVAKSTDCEDVIKKKRKVIVKEQTIKENSVNSESIKGAGNASEDYNAVLIKILANEPNHIDFRLIDGYQKYLNYNESDLKLKQKSEI